MTNKLEYVVFLNATDCKIFTDKEESITFAEENNKEVWEQTITSGNCIIKDIKIFPKVLTGNNLTSTK